MKVFGRPHRTTLSACACAVSIALASCGGSSDDDDNQVSNDDNTNDILSTPVSTPDIDMSDLGTPDTGSNTSVDNPVILPTEDIFTGGYVGNSGPLRDTVTIPENAAGYLIGVAERVGNTGVDLKASFGSFVSERQFSEFVSDFNRPLDSCHLASIIPLRGFAENFASPPFFIFRKISAGEVLPLFNSAGVTVGELVDEGLLTYRPSAAFEGSVPDNEPLALSVSIPGAEFPGFEIAEFPESNELTGFRAQNSTQALDDTNFNPAETPVLVWDASTDPNTYIHLDFSADIPASEPGANDDLSVSVHCSLEDDGEFRFPQEVIDLYPRTPFNANLSQPLRVAIEEVTQTDATLFLVNYSSAGL